MDKDNPTNADIYQTLGTVLERLDGNHKVYTNEFDEVKKRQDKTNGRVSKLEKWRDNFVSGLDAVKSYKAENGTSIYKSPEFLDLLKKLTWLVGIIGLAIAYRFGVS